MRVRNFALLAAMALAGSMTMVACDNNNRVLPPQEDGAPLSIFGHEVGVPVNLITATRGDGVSFDKFQVTFNNEEGTDITITTPEGEELRFTELDVEWVSDLFGRPMIRLLGDDGDKLEVVLNSIEVEVQNDPDCPEDCDTHTEDIAVYAAARLDEEDTGDGFETYAVVGMETLTANLPRYSGDDEEIVDGECVAGCEGTLVTGHADYDGAFVASLYRDGEILTDEVMGRAWIDIDFANNVVEFDAKGGYDLGWNSYDVRLSGDGEAAHGLTFDETVQYEGTIGETSHGDSWVEVKSGWHDSDYVDVEGTFAGAVYGPGGVEDVDSYDELDTATAGVFEASGDNDGVTNAIMIVGGFGSEEGTWRDDSLVEEPLAE